MKTGILFFILVIGLAMSISSCDKIEDTSRLVVVNGLHPAEFDYHIGIGLNAAETIANWDTAGNVVITIEAKAGDALYYNMNSQAPMCGLNIMVDGVDKLNVNLEGQIPNGTVGFLVLD